MIKRKWIIGLLVSIAILWIAIIAAAKWVQLGLNHGGTPAVAAWQDQSQDLKVYWPVPAFSFPDQDNRTVTNLSLKGHVWVADFIYTQCTSACPIMTSKMLLIQQQASVPQLRFVSFSVDPEHDTPAALKDYARLWHGDESRWRLLSTDTRGLADVAAGMKVSVSSTGQKDNPILHSNLFMLVDAAGQVRGIYDSSDSDAMQQLLEDIHTLAGNDTPEPSTAAANTPQVERGRELYGTMGCLGCHSQSRIAPPLQNVYGSRVRLDDHRTVWADEAYLHESIVEPGAKVVEGYTRSMPSYRSYLSDAQVQDLVSYIQSLSNNAPGGHGYASTAPTTQDDSDELLTDPVCKMQVRKDPTAPMAVFNGKTYYFCSDHCRDQFLKKPAAYAPEK
jgi:protein SCO1/2